MKQKDIAMIIIIAALSGVVSFFVSNKLFVTPDNRQQNVTVVDPISSEFNPPDNQFFNDQSINPTIDSGLGNTNTTPFNTTE